ncbi:MAG TPA: DEAD/DEAH box helicase, partial [Balneola sp.]|nr:DEAD/DEAH box helicase [Balneola sp.]
MPTFKELGLKQELLDAVEKLGFTQPTKVQELAIPTILESQRDLIALAQTGTGKTGAFGLPSLHQIDTNSDDVQVLVLSPTRELAIQIARDLKDFAKYQKAVKTVAVYGGANISTQIKALRNGCQVVIGTPGRMLDLINRKQLDVRNVRTLVLDEADEMLNMGFQDDLDAILKDTPKEKQTLLFSATMPKGIAKIAKKYMNNPEEIEVGERNAGAKNVEHHYYMVHAKNRFEALKRVTDMNPDIYGIIFCRTRRETAEIASKLNKDGYDVDLLNGDLSQAQRDDVMDRFRTKDLQLLVATDVAARGLDVNELTHVINYNLPDDLEVYIHRSGRTGRAGNSGISISIIHTRETGRIRALEKMSGKDFIKKEVPSGEEICGIRMLNLIDTVKETKVNEEQMAKFLPEALEKLADLERD